MRIMRRERRRPRGLLLAGAVLTALLATAATASAQSARAPVPEPMPSGVGGTVTLVPEHCPAFDCEGMPLGATVAAWRDGRIVATTQTERGGRYAMDLRPGRYVLVAYPWTFRPVDCEPVGVYVPGGKHVLADITCVNGPPDPGPASR